MSSTPAKTRIGIRIVALLVSVGLSLLVAEVGVRLLKPQHTYAQLEALVGTFYAPGTFNPFTLRANYEGSMPSMEYLGRTVKISTNSLNLRGPEITRQKPPGTTRVLVLGDSYTFGVFVDDTETYSRVLQDLLTGQGRPVQVINAGYSDGWDPDHHYCWLANRGLEFEPDVIVYAFFVGNDIMNIRPHLWSERDARDLPVEITDPSMYVDALGRVRRSRTYRPEEIVDIPEPAYTVGDEWIYQVPGLRQSQFFVLLGKTVEGLFRKLEAEEYSGDDLNWYPHIMFSEAGPGFAEKEQHFLKLVHGLAATAREREIEFMVLMIPFNFQVHPEFLPLFFPQYRHEIAQGKVKVARNYFEDLAPTLDAAGIEYVDILERMRREPARYYPANGEVHMNPAGHAFVARALQQRLTELGWLP